MQKIELGENNSALKRDSVPNDYSKVMWTPFYWAENSYFGVTFISVGHTLAFECNSINEQ